jgi:starch synthase (maltosyl-transferring)
MQEPTPLLKATPGGRIQRFVGDRVRFTLTDSAMPNRPEGWRARLRTNLGRAELICREITEAHTRKLPIAGASWHDLPMQRENGGWSLELPLTEPGYFKAKPYLMDAQGWQYWPEGPDIGIAAHPDAYRTANTIYCAFTRMFGETRTLTRTVDEKQEEQFKEWDKLGYTMIPPSGKFRDLIRQLPHIMDTLGCRILQLLPVNPTPTTYARFGRFGSPYASLGMTAIDPALVEFDKKTTGVDQFRELGYAVHARGGRIFLDVIINHTGWGSVLQENHPEWFLRNAKGEFESPGAWGTVWEDLVELEHRHVELWDELAGDLLVWCRRGVDGFRCDAGYKVPLPAWQYITARVRQEFPQTIFLLEGLGGAWELTEQLLTEGGMQWAYSELFQNYSGTEVANYLDHCLRQNNTTGLLVHYSETHDNPRLAAKGRAWSLLRNRLCALASASGGYGFTCGVEWLAPERVNVHSSRGLAWGGKENIVPDLARLSQLLAEHPCFFDAAKLSRLSAQDSVIYAMRRDSAEGKDSVLVLVNNDVDKPQSVLLAADALKGLGKLQFELTGLGVPKSKASARGEIEFLLEPGGCYCLCANRVPQGLAGEEYRRTRALSAWALDALRRVLPIEKIPAFDWRELARVAGAQPVKFLAACPAGDAARVREQIEGLIKNTAGQGTYEPVVVWTLSDRSRIMPVPGDHWLLLRDTVPFRATLNTIGPEPAQHVQSITAGREHIACFAPGQSVGDAQLTVERYAVEDQQVEAQIRFLAPGPDLDSGGGKPLAISNLAVLRDVATTARAVKSAAVSSHSREQPLVLLTDSIGGMARMCVDLGAIKSKYDCLLGANLDPRLPVDRHVFAKRARVWVNADGFISPLDLRSLASFEPGPPAKWHFIANAGDGRTVEIVLIAAMLPGRNTTALFFDRPLTNLKTDNPLPDDCDVRLTVRVDIEDRNFHSETHRNGGADYHFNTNTHTLEDQAGFAFTPTADRQLRVTADAGVYHPQPEWCENIPHPIEQTRGQVASGDAYSPGWFELRMPRGAAVTMLACADATEPKAEEIQKAKMPGDDGKISAFAENDLFGRQLLKAAGEYVVRWDSGVTVIAGYPWFLNWGRDSLICARGLLAGGMTGQVKGLLTTFARFEKDGTLPNTIHGEDTSNRDTSDAPLWFGIVCEELAARTGAELYGIKADASRTMGDVLLDIARGYAKGTPNGIRMDAESGLIWSPSHFTWMDTNYPAGTPREGYPVEIQVLWVRLLRQAAKLSGGAERGRWEELAARAEGSFKKYFWLEERGWFADQLVAKPGQTAAQGAVDNSLRSNYLMAVSLDLVTGEAARRCVNAAVRYLVVPGALRTLAPLAVSPPLPIYGNQGQLLNDPVHPYWGHYEGDEDTRRKPAYHNGTAWTWTFPIFCEALAKAWDCSPEAVAAARAYLGSMDRLLMGGCVGQIPEILDGDAPHTQRGCDAQAWGVTEALRVWKWLQSFDIVKPGK